MCLGIPGKVLEIYQQNDLPMGKVEFGGILKEICLAYTPEAVVGDYRHRPRRLRHQPRRRGRSGGNLRVPGGDWPEAGDARRRG